MSDCLAEIHDRNILDKLCLVKIKLEKCWLWDFMRSLDIMVKSKGRVENRGLTGRS